ncbi:unnamed protein product, partial [marine sediment metagenome]
MQAGSPEHSITYRAASYNGIDTACNGVLEVFLLNVNGKLSVSVDKGGGAADGVQPLVFSVWPFHADKLKDFIQKGIILRDPSGSAVGLVGNLLVQPRDITFVVKS